LDENIKMDTIEKGFYDVDCIHLARCWFFVKTVLNFCLHKSRGISWLSEELLDSEEEPCKLG
jgi:hypothetical protein